MYSAATIKRAQTICANVENAKQNSRKARAVKAAKTVDPDAWKKRPASKAQIGRINGLEKALGYRVSTAKVIGTAGQASDLYRALKAEAL